MPHLKLPPLESRTKPMAKVLGRQVRSVQRFRQSVQPVVGLEWVKVWKDLPPHKETTAGMTPRQKRGKAYEKSFGEHLAKLCTDGTSPLYPGELYSGQWLRFEDAGGKSWAQPDFYILQAGLNICWIFEAKLTYVDTAVEQLNLRYSPLLDRLYPDFFQQRVVVCYDLAARSGGLMPVAVRSLDALLAAQPASHYVWNWRG